MNIEDIYKLFGLNSTAYLCINSGNDIDNSERSDLHAYFERTVRNYQQSSNYISKRMLLVLVNPHLENQTIFSKVPTFPGN